MRNTPKVAFVWVLGAACVVWSSHAWTSSTTKTAPTTTPSYKSRTAVSASTTTDATSTDPIHTPDELLTPDSISKLRFRELKRELQARSLTLEGTTGQLRVRLRQAVGLPDPECIVNEDGIEDDCQTEYEMARIVTFRDESDPEYEVKELMAHIEEKAALGHWKAATRKLKTLTRRFANTTVPESVYLTTLEACMANRLQGARASEPARKILEKMVEQGYAIPDTVGNFCVKTCLGEQGTDSTHQGFGGIDTALAIVAAMEQANTPLQLETYDKLIQALVKEGSVDHALALIRTVVVEQAQTPSLETFDRVARCAVSRAVHDDEAVLSVLTICKASGYDLDTIAATEAGRAILACGVIAAERLGNDALAFRLLTAASKAKGVAPDRGDIMIALGSSTAQRACTLIHKRAINKAVEDGQWQLSVKVLELMLERSLKPSNWVWRNVVTCCAKAKKSKKATAVLLDWVKLSEDLKADKPPLSVFNTVVNVCEICDEQELTLLVLDKMKQTHDTEGNIITFNIALKRLAKQGNYQACEGIILGMLQAGVEPSVVSYTTAIASCASAEERQPTMAYEWLKRMRSRNVNPNVLTYNTAMAACLDGKLESSFIGSKLAKEMLDDVNMQLQQGDESSEVNAYTNVIPDSATKNMARQLMTQLKSNWKEGAIDKRVATDTVRVPLKELVNFSRSEAADRARQETAKRTIVDDDQAASTALDEIELEYTAASSTHRSAEV